MAPSPSSAGTEFVKAASVTELTDGQMCVAEVGGTEVLLARVGARIFAVDNVCSHAEGWLDMGVLHPDSCEVQCPLHDGRFDLTSGAPTREPCTEPIKTYPVDVRGDAIYVGITPAGIEKSARP